MQNHQLNIQEKSKESPVKYTVSVYNTDSSHKCTVEHIYIEEYKSVPPNRGGKPKNPYKMPVLPPPKLPHEHIPSFMSGYYIKRYNDKTRSTDGTRVATRLEPKQKPQYIRKTKIPKSTQIREPKPRTVEKLSPTALPLKTTTSVHNLVSSKDEDVNDEIDLNIEEIECSGDKRFGSLWMENLKRLERIGTFPHIWTSSSSSSSSSRSTSSTFRHGYYAYEIPFVPLLSAETHPELSEAIHL